MLNYARCNRLQKYPYPFYTYRVDVSLCLVLSAILVPRFSLVCSVSNSSMPTTAWKTEKLRMDKQASIFDSPSPRTFFFCRNAVCIYLESNGMSIDRCLSVARTCHQHLLCAPAFIDIVRDAFVRRETGDGRNPRGYEVPLRLHGASCGLVSHLCNGTGHGQRSSGCGSHVGEHDVAGICCSRVLALEICKHKTTILVEEGCS